MGSKRPNPAQWLWYGAGGRLPYSYREWVLHDVTARTWVFRHAARSSVLLLPLILVWLLMPGPLGLRLALVAMAALVGFFYSFAYMEESCEHRLAKYGYPRGTAKKVRAERDAEKDAEAWRRYKAVHGNGNGNGSGSE